MRKLAVFIEKVKFQYGRVWAGLQLAVGGGKGRRQRPRRGSKISRVGKAGEEKEGPSVW